MRGKSVCDADEVRSFKFCVVPLQVVVYRGTAKKTPAGGVFADIQDKIPGKCSAARFRRLPGWQDT